MALQLRDGPLVPVWSGHHQARPCRAMREHFGLSGDGAIWLHVGTFRESGPTCSLSVWRVEDFCLRSALAVGQENLHADRLVWRSSELRQWGHTIARVGFVHRTAAAGVDGQSITRFAAKAIVYLSELSAALRDGTYSPQAVKRVDKRRKPSWGPQVCSRRY